MEAANSILIAIDPGHGGGDLGAVSGNRLEKDDTLRLANALQRRINAMGMGVVMTRSDDYNLPLLGRVWNINETDADLCLSLHRGRSEKIDRPDSGFVAQIYPTAPRDSTEKAAKLILEELSDTGSLKGRDVKRSALYILRRTIMPTIFLELGYIDNEEDNRLFDRELEQFSSAIARGVFRYFGYSVPEEQPEPPVLAPLPVPVPSPLPVPPAIPMYISGEAPAPTLLNASPSPLPVEDVKPASMPGESHITEAQRTLNDKYGFQLELSGSRDKETLRAAIMALQSELSLQRGHPLPVDGILDDKLKSLLKPISPIEKGMVFLLQVLLMLNGYDVGAIDGICGAGTRLAMQLFQRDHYLAPNGLIEPEMLVRLLS